jgi:hypothetical protein
MKPYAVQVFSKAPPSCVNVRRITFAVSFVNGVFSIAFLSCLAAKLRNSRFGDNAYIEAMAEEFDNTTRKRFNGAGDSYIKFSNMVTDRDIQVGIRNGQIKLTKCACLTFSASI